ncbi:DUF6002 family protein [Spirillospora sp. CA-294931]|uniref:DUF6002 family protein n=1 Tax=Spirillospora sp. CA-294931 TaxID=3240042 RepID=UPI003D92EF11
MVMPIVGQGTAVVSNALIRYLPGVHAAMSCVRAERAADAHPAPPFELPAMSAALERYLDASEIALTKADEQLYLLDLMRHPGTRTTKTIASLVMVARAVEHIRRTGERLLILTPTSGNKGTALRDAVARAYETGLAGPDELRIVVVAPEASRSKLRSGALSDDEHLRRANPVAVARVDRAADVKELSRLAAEQAAERLSASGFGIWYTLDLDNYRVADAVRAFVEADLLPIREDSPPRVHAHAVSSAFGLLGYRLGHRVLSSGLLPGQAAPAWHPGFFLVQHLATADMVLSLLGAERPRYRHERADGLWHQESDPHFPAVTDDPFESLDSTFYTPRPVTSAQIDKVVHSHGGGGVVVSKRDCLAHYAEVCRLADRAGIGIDPDPGRIREWSLVKALTGVLVARERGLLETGTEVVVHASGYYTDALIPPLPERLTEPVGDVPELVRVLSDAARS